MYVIIILQPGYPLLSFCKKIFLCLGRRQKYQIKELNAKIKEWSEPQVLMQPCALVIFFKLLLLKGACQKNRSLKFSVYLKKVELDLMSLTSNSPEARFCYPDSVHTPEMVMNLDTTSVHWMLINRLHLSPTYSLQKIVQ